jgi:ribosome recycling factor
MADNEEIELIFMDAEERMAKSVGFFRTESEGIRTGRANPGMLESVKIDLYGTNMQLNQVATITAPDSRMLAVQPFDKSTVGAIERELLKSDLGLTPNSDGNIIRLPIPPMTKERRLDMIKRLKRLQEDSHVAVRNVRRDIQDQLRGMEKDKSISQDELHRYQDQLQKLTDEHVAKADDIGARKEAELAAV